MTQGVIKEGGRETPSSSPLLESGEAGTMPWLRSGEMEGGLWDWRGEDEDDEEDEGCDEWESEEEGDWRREDGWWGSRVTDLAHRAGINVRFFGWVRFFSFLFSFDFSFVPIYKPFFF